ncbi:olfactory receptor-like protein COR2 [Maylandia zebra]|uniref:olfactory receptor-like protein COR2 n=1 Tax=Maylandia zebra TaxID=106582 RepID=UPI00403D33E2
MGALYSTAVYPKYLNDFLSEKQVISYSACLFQYFLFYSLACSEFFLLAAMGYDRYVAICKSLQYPTIMRKKDCEYFPVHSFACACFYMTIQAIGSAKAKLCSFYLNETFCNNRIYTFQCVRSELFAAFALVCLLDLGILPLLFILYTYTKIFLMSYRSCKEIRKKAAETCLPHLTRAPPCASSTTSGCRSAPHGSSTASPPPGSTCGVSGSSVDHAWSIIAALRFAPDGGQPGPATIPAGAVPPSPAPAGWLPFRPPFGPAPPFPGSGLFPIVPRPGILAPLWCG